MDNIDKSSRSSSIFRARQDSDFPVYNKAQRSTSDALDYSLAAKVYLEEQSVYLSTKKSLRNFNLMLLISLILISMSFILVQYLACMCFIYLGTIDIIVSAFLVQNLLLVGVALCVKLGESISKIAVLYRLLQFVLFESTALLVGSIIIGTEYSDEIDTRKFHIILIIQLVEALRILILLRRTNRILKVLKEIANMQDHFATLIMSDKSSIQY